MGKAQDALNAIGEDAIIARLIDGDSYRAIAQDAGVQKSSLFAWLNESDERSARAKEALITSARSFEDMAFTCIEDAADPFSLAKAKELAHHYRWAAKMRDRGTYGEKVSVAGNVGVSFITGQTPADERI